MKIAELLADIRNRDLVLPEFQREYVWTREQAKQLMVSLLKEYPVGSLLFWKTDRPPDLKNVPVLPEKLGTLQVILDGQQRLTTLYMLIVGDIPPYYRQPDIEATDPRNLYFNLENGEFQYYQATRMQGNPLWCRVTDCYNDTTINVFQIAKERSQDSQTILELAQLYTNHLTRLRNVREATIPHQLVPHHASLDEAIDIFDRVNSLGTKLSDAELALTHVTGKWPAARRVMKEKIQELGQHYFYFDLTFMTRALTVAATQRALFEMIHDRPRENLESSWQALEKILDYLANILPGRAFIHSTEDLNTTNVLVPLIAYLLLNKGKFPTDKSLKNAFHWLYAAQMWARYTAQTDQRLEQDVSLVFREDSPWETLRGQIIDQRGRIEVKPSDLEGRGLQHPLYRMVYILAKAHAAMDWFNGAPLGTSHGQAYRIHNHHIFPQSELYKSTFDGDNHLHRKMVNEIANRAFLTAETNQTISDRLPETYLPEVEDRYPGALARQFVPMDPALWKVERYSDFLEARREIVARKLNEFMASMIAEPEPTRERPITDLVKLGESLTFEMKSTLQWDVIQNQINKNLRHSVLRTVSAFLNTEGGTLVIGVEDTGAVYGLEKDLGALENSIDRFGQLLSNLISEHIGPQYGPLVRIRFQEIEGKQVCVVDVERSPEPAFLTGTKGKEFYIRVGNTSRALDPEQTVAFVEMNAF